MKKLASKFVDKAGEDIVSESGNAFGRNKPKAKADRKASAALYEAK